MSYKNFYLASLAGVYTVVFATGAVTADDAHVLEKKC